MRTSLMGIALLVGCQSASAVGDPPDQPPLVPPTRPPPRVEQDLAVRFHMYRSLDLARAIERLLIRGNLDDARALATSIAEAPDPAGLEAWARQATILRDRARALAAATNLDEACRRQAQLAAACADCHRDVGVLAQPTLAVPPPPDRGTIADRMARHRWAADRMWEGMIAGDDATWRAGLDVLAAAPLPFSPSSSARVVLAKQLQQLAEQGQQRQTTDTPSERAQLYGEILVTCAACHTSNAPATLRSSPPGAR